MQLANAIPHTIGMITSCRRERQDTIEKNQDEEHRRRRRLVHHGIPIPVLLPGNQRLERDQVVVAKDLDLLTGLAGHNILHSQWVDAQCAGCMQHVLFGGVADIQPPDCLGSFGLVDEMGQVVRERLIPGLCRNDPLRRCRAEGEAGHVHVDDWSWGFP